MRIEVDNFVVRRFGYVSLIPNALRSKRNALRIRSLILNELRVTNLTLDILA
jgi:hypothetical protein